MEVLTRLDRLQVTAVNRKELAGTYRRLLGAEVVREDSVAALSALRTVIRLGESEIEILEADGVGAVADFVGRRGGGLFAAGFATPDPAALAAHLLQVGASFTQEGEQLFLRSQVGGLPGMNLVVTPQEEREPIGLVRRLYEVTNLVDDFEKTTRRVATLFGLDSSRFVPIRSEQYGYAGTLTLFQEDSLDRIEIITPFAVTKTMGRFFQKRGACLYMAYMEADDTAAIRERLLEYSPQDWTGPGDAALPDNLYLHPQLLGGVMLGVSRTSFAWTWSGRPERVTPPA